MKALKLIWRIIHIKWHHAMLFWKLDESGPPAKANNVIFLVYGQMLNCLKEQLA